MPGFMDTFFFISLGIAFVLILLLVYHFKQRLSATESKCDTMFEIINGLVSEINGIKGALMARPPPMESIQSLGIPPGHMFSNMSGGEQPPVVHHGENSLTGIEEMDSDDEVEEEDSDDEIEDSDDEEDSDDDVEEESVDDDSQRVLGSIDIDEKIMVSDNEEDDLDSNIVEVAINNMQPVEEKKAEEEEDFTKMTLPRLKAYITEKGFVEDAKKMKKAEILDLLKKQEVSVEA